MHRWAYMASGVMVGIIAVLLTVVVMQNREPQAWAAPMMQQGGQQAETLQMYTGGCQTNTQDIVWILYKRTGSTKGDEKGVLSKPERITLCCYQVANGARTMKLVAIRDISFDMDVIEYGNEKPHVKDIIDEIKKTEKPPK